VILTPNERTLTAKIKQANALWTALGCRVEQMSPESHDAAFAAVSHLPHMLAFALMNSINDQEQAAQFLSLAGPGFRDFTRIAASDPKVWRDILLANRKELLLQSRNFQEHLKVFEYLMNKDDGQGIEQLIAAASSTRAAWHIKQQPKPC
jgi:prephenate dehydrogenase